MTRSINLRRSLALTGALVLTTWGVAALPATAEPGSGQSGQHAQSEGQGQATAPGQNKDKTKGQHKGQHKGQGNGAENKGGNGDPAGNNGTVKIAPLGELDGIPDNSPHPGCTFQVEWYGFDEGDDILSKVTFAMQAPTDDVGLAVAGLNPVPVGGDPASGAGTETGQDGAESYTLSFTGEPHPQQGYHVKLTIETPHSLGNDTKSKVFWVAPCESETAATEDETTDEGATDEGVVTEDDTTTEGETAAAGSEEATAADDTLVLGAQASTGDDTEVAAAEATSADAEVPTVIDAGQSAIAWASSPLGLLVIALGGLLTALAFVARRRASVRAGE